MESRAPLNSELLSSDLEIGEDKETRITPCKIMDIWVRGITYGIFAALPIASAAALFGWIGGVVVANSVPLCPYEHNDTVDAKCVLTGFSANVGAGVGAGIGAIPSLYFFSKEAIQKGYDQPNVQVRPLDGLAEGCAIGRDMIRPLYNHLCRRS